MKLATYSKDARASTAGHVEDGEIRSFGRLDLLEYTEYERNTDRRHRSEVTMRDLGGTANPVRANGGRAS